jgi:1,2-diacylglycerol 3-alpha-glucosyltransferase
MIDSWEKTMHIAHYTNAYHPVISGVVRSVSTFRQAFTRLGHNVFVFAQEANGYEDKEPFIFRYPAINLPLAGDFPAVIPFSSSIDQILPSLKLDVIHTHHPVLLGQIAAHKASELNLPLVFTFHTQYREYSHYFPLPQEVVQSFVKGAIDNWLKDFMQKCQHIVVPTESMRQELANNYGLKNFVDVVPTGIDLDPYLRADGEEIRSRRGWDNFKVMISVGRLAPEKNWRVLLEASSIVMKDHSDLKTVLIGEGPDRDDLENYVRDLGIEERVEFLGRVPFEEIPSHLKAADFFGFASVSETQGLVSLEALASGLPVVAIDATGTRDVVEDGVVGLLTGPNPEDLASGIRRMLDDSDLVHRFRSNAIDRAASFDIMIQAQKLISVYEKAIEAKREKRFVILEPARGKAVESHQVKQ